jgi:Periplasmic protease
MRFKLFASLVLVSFIGCAVSTFVTGNDFDMSKISRINKGETTKQDVLELFGQPYIKSSNNSFEIWTYQYIRSTGKATSFLVVTSASGQAYYKSLSITFDLNGKVQSFTQSVSGHDDSAVQPGVQRPSDTEYDNSGKIGITFDYQGIISEILKDSPAYLAGLRKGDKILRIDGEPIPKNNINSLYTKVTGKPGTMVYLVIDRDNKEIVFEVKRVRM